MVLKLFRRQIFRHYVGHHSRQQLMKLEVEPGVSASEQKVNDNASIYRYSHEVQGGGED